MRTSAKKNSPSWKAGGSGEVSLKAGVAAFKRGWILEEAAKLFYTQGYETATLDMLAERLEVTKPFLYSYFHSKSEMLAAICELGIQESLAALDDAKKYPGNAAARLRATLASVASIIIDRHAYIVVYQREMMNLDREDAQRTLRQRHEFDVQLARLVSACQEEGLVNLPDAAAMSPWMGGLLSWIPNYYVPGSKRPREEVVESAVHACMRLIGLN